MRLGPVAEFIGFLIISNFDGPGSDFSVLKEKEKKTFEMDPDPTFILKSHKKLNVKI